jgi:hypothetical protein
MYFYPIKSSLGIWLSTNRYDAITFGNVVTAPQDVITAGRGSYIEGGGYRYSAREKGTDPHWTYAHEVDHYRTQDILGAYYLPLHALSQGMGSAELMASPYRYPQSSYIEQWPFKLFPYGR